MRPADKRRSGTVSEGAAAVVSDEDRRTGAGSHAGRSRPATTPFTAAPARTPRAPAWSWPPPYAAGMTADAIEHICAHAWHQRQRQHRSRRPAQPLRHASPLTCRPQIPAGAPYGQPVWPKPLSPSWPAERRHSSTINHEQLDPACDPSAYPAKPLSNGQTAIANSAGIPATTRPWSSIPQAAASGTCGLDPYQPVFVRQIGWVLPGHIGKGGEILEHPSGSNGGTDAIGSWLTSAATSVPSRATSTPQAPSSSPPWSRRRRRSRRYPATRRGIGSLSATAPSAQPSPSSPNWLKNF